MQFMSGVRAAASIAILLAIAAASLAQKNLMGVTGKVMLILQPDIKAHLKITDEQYNQIRLLIRDMKAQGGSAATFEYPMRKLDEEAVKLLDDKQNLRLSQLWRQYNGPLILRLKDVAEAFGITGDAYEKIRAIGVQNENRIMTLIQEKKGAVPEKELMAIRNESNEAILAILSGAQRSAWKASLGESYRFKL